MKSEKGFFALGIVLIIFLSFVPVLHMLSNLFENTSAMSFTYNSKNQATALFDETQQILQNYQACSSTFKASSLHNYHREVTEVKDLYENKFATQSRNDYRIHFKKAILCFDKNASNEECENTEGVLVKHPVKNSFSNVGSLYLESYSEWTDELITKRVPIFIEVDAAISGEIVKCSTALPALSSEVCESIDITKTCCRYQHTLHLDEAYSTSSSNPPVSKGKEYHETKDYIQSASDPHNTRVYLECESSLKNARLEAICVGSSWNYKVWCE